MDWIYFFFLREKEYIYIINKIKLIQEEKQEILLIGIFWDCVRYRQLSSYDDPNLHTSI